VPKTRLLVHPLCTSRRQEQTWNKSLNRLTGLSGLTLGLLARSRHASGRSCDLPALSRVFMVFLDPRASVELVLIFHTPPMLIPKFYPNAVKPCLTPFLCCISTKQAIFRRFTLFSSQRLTLSPTHLYHKDEQTLSGNPQTRTLPAP
jgi:hypothetical protein